MTRLGTMICPCCGARERTSGCVRGFPCDCGMFTDYCQECHKCDKHCTCSKEHFLTNEQLQQLGIDLNHVHGINNGPDVPLSVFLGKVEKVVDTILSEEKERLSEGNKLHE